MIKSLPRTIQFIVTSRNEEQCEDKINISEFKKDDTGIEFIERVIDSQEFNVAISRENCLKLLEASKGNALIIVQVLNSLHRGVSSFNEIIISLESLRSKNSEIISGFMYKNTLDHALSDLSEKGYPVIDVVRIISLYDEKIELYSISKLAGGDVSCSEYICNNLCQRLVLNKNGEYYELNEFAKRFVFIKLLPDRFKLSEIKDKIKKHKERMKNKLFELDSTLRVNVVLQKNLVDWQPRNYIDKIVIAELFSLYGDAIKYVGKESSHNKKDNEKNGSTTFIGNKNMYDKYLKEFNDHSLITNHPFVHFQRARLLKEGIPVFYKDNEDVINQVESAYEQGIDAIEYDYVYLINTIPHASLKMFLGIFFYSSRKDYSRAIRFLEESKAIFEIKKDKAWFICCNYLSLSYQKMYDETNNYAYKSSLVKTIKEVLNSHCNRNEFNIGRFKNKFSHVIDDINKL